MGNAVITLDDFGRTDLRLLADKLLESTIVEYVDGGVLLPMNPPGVEHREIVRATIAAIYRASAESANPSLGGLTRAAFSGNCSMAPTGSISPMY
jgi:hypothetical protein